MKYLFLIFSVILFFNCNSQKPLNEEKKNSVGIFYSSCRFYDNLKPIQHPLNIGLMYDYNYNNTSIGVSFSRFGTFYTQKLNQTFIREVYFIAFDFKKRWDLNNSINIELFSGINNRFGNEKYFAGIYGGFESVLVKREMLDFGLSFGMKLSIRVYKEINIFFQIRQSAYLYRKYKGESVSNIEGTPIFNLHNNLGLNYNCRQRR